MTRCVPIDATTLCRDGAFTAATSNTEWSTTWVSPLGPPHRVAYRGVWYGPVLRGLVVATLEPGEKGITRWGDATFVRLTQTRPFLGGARTWLVCPGMVNEYPCARRVRIIYALWGTNFWGCRLCLGLTYRSRRFHRRRIEEAFSQLERLQRLQRDLASRRWRRRVRALRRFDRVEHDFTARRELDQLQAPRRAERAQTDG